MHICGTRGRWVKATGITFSLFKSYFIHDCVFSHSLVVFLLKSTWKKTMILLKAVILGQTLKAQYDMNGLNNNTAIRKVVLINNNRGIFHPVLSDPYVSKFQNDIFLKLWIGCFVIQLSSNFLPISMWSDDSLLEILGSVWTAELHKYCDAFWLLTPDFKHRKNLSDWVIDGHGPWSERPDWPIFVNLVSVHDWMTQI